MYKKLIALLLAFVVIAAACGSDEAAETGDDEGTATTEAVADDTATTEAMDDEGTATTEAMVDAACSDGLLHADGVLTAATGEPAFLPWIADDNPESGEGFESALVYALAGEMGLDVAWTRTEFTEAVANGGAGDYDFNIQQYSITPDRDEVVDFSDGYYEVEQAVIGAADSPAAGATSIADLKELNLGAQIATTSLDYIDQIIQPSSDAAVYDDNVAAKSAFDAGQVDAIVFDLPTAYYVTAAEIEDSQILGVLPRVGDDPDELGMLFETGNPLIPCVNAALATLRDNGTMAELEGTWLTQGGDLPTLTE